MLSVFTTLLSVCTRLKSRGQLWVKAVGGTVEAKIAVLFRQRHSKNHCMGTPWVLNDLSKTMINLLKNWISRIFEAWEKTRFENIFEKRISHNWFLPARMWLIIFQISISFKPTIPFFSLYIPVYRTRLGLASKNIKWMFWVKTFIYCLQKMILSKAILINFRVFKF